MSPAAAVRTGDCIAAILADRGAAARCTYGVLATAIPRGKMRRISRENSSGEMAVRSMDDCTPGDG